MKKIYNQPKTEIVLVELQPMLEVSGTGDSVKGVSVSDTDYDPSKGGIQGRGGSIWDDED